MTDPHSNLREIVAELSVSHESIRTILNYHLGMKRLASPKRVAEDILGVVVTEDEIRVYEFIMQTSHQVSVRRLPTDPKPKKHAKVGQKSKSC